MWVLLWRKLSCAIASPPCIAELLWCEGMWGESLWCQWLCIVLVCLWVGAVQDGTGITAEQALHVFPYKPHCQVAAGKWDLLLNTISILLKSFFPPLNCSVTHFD